MGFARIIRLPIYFNGSPIDSGYGNENGETAKESVRPPGGGCYSLMVSFKLINFIISRFR